MSFEEEETETYKIILIGDSAVGKTSIINRFSKDEFSEKLLSTIGVDFRCKDINVDGTLVKLQLWDTAGQERFQSISKNFYRGAHGIIVVYAINDINSFQSVRVWLTEIDKNIGANDTSTFGAAPTVVKYLVGNKADLEDVRCVVAKSGKAEAETYGIKFMETSAKSAKNIEELFVDIARDIRKVAHPIQKSSGPSLDDKSKAKSDGCC